MAIKIVKLGVVPEERPVEATCQYCETVLTYTSEDLQMTGRIACPVCRKTVVREDFIYKWHR